MSVVELNPTGTNLSQDQVIGICKICRASSFSFNVVVTLKHLCLLISIFAWISENVLMKI